MKNISSLFCLSEKLRYWAIALVNHSEEIGEVLICD